MGKRKSKGGDKKPETVTYRKSWVTVDDNEHGTIGYREREPYRIVVHNAPETDQLHN